MSNKYKYYCSPTVSRSDMEMVKENIGKVNVTPTEVIAGECQSYKITYTVGEERIEIGGVIRFSIPFGFTAPQKDLPIRPGYVTVSTDKPGVNLTIEFRKKIWHEKSFSRTKAENNTEHTGENVYVIVTGRALEKGDVVVLNYGDISYGSEGAYAPKTLGPLQFDVAVDCDGFGKAPFSGFYLCDDVPFVNVCPLHAVALNLIAPSNAVVGRPIELIITALDKYKNIDFNYYGQIDVYNGNQKIKSLYMTKDDGGLCNTNITLMSEGITYLKAVALEDDFEAYSNPIICETTETNEKYFWGDIHGHSAIQWGQGSGEAYYEYGEKIAGLDFCCLSDPGAGRYTDDNETSRNSLSCYMTDEEWKSIQDINKCFYKPGKFVPILGYEYHNDAKDPKFGGDRNVYFDSYDAPIFRCCDEGSFTPEQLWEKLQRNNIKAITIPHHTAKSVMLNNINLHNEYYQRLIEIYSSWGNSECKDCERPIIGGANYINHSVQDALARGERLGFVGASDTHSGQPGFTYWVFENRSYRGGLTCAITNELDYEHIFDAMWNRNVYATTGERIILKFHLNNVSMGQEIMITREEEIMLEADVIGTDEIEKVEIIKNGVVIHKAQCNEGKHIKVKFSDNSGTSNGSWSYYYVRVLQKDKAMAWSSPIWVIFNEK